MFDEIDRLNLEIVNVQVLDGYIRDGNIRFDKFFMRAEYKYQMNKYKNLLKTYDDKKGFVIDTGYDDGYIEDDYTLDDVLEELVEEIDVYSLVYNVPEVLIDQDEWEILFEAIGGYYIHNELDGYFMADMIELNRYAMARSLVYEEDYIGLDTYIKSLKYLESNILSIDNIVQIAERISEMLSVDAVAILANEDGTYGCKNKDANLFIVDEDIDEEDHIKSYVESKGYQVVDTIDVVEQKNNINNDSNVVNFDDIKIKRKLK